MLEQVEQGKEAQADRHPEVLSRREETEEGQALDTVDEEVPHKLERVLDLVTFWKVRPRILSSVTVLVIRAS